MKSHFKSLLFILFIFTVSEQSVGQIPLVLRSSSEVIFGTGEFAPYYLVSNRHGVPSLNPNNGYLRAELQKPVRYDRKFDYGFGVDALASYNNTSVFRLQQLYGEVRYRGINLMFGSKEYGGVFKNEQLSSGGMVWSGNARPIPQIRLSIPNFITVPFTSGWVQIKGDVAYGKFLGDDWLREQYDYQSWFITTDVWYHTKSLFFRSKEEKRFILTLGLEASAQFGGNHRSWSNQSLTNEIIQRVRFKDFLNILIPGKGDETSAAGDQAYMYGNHLGAWHGVGEYKFRNESVLKGYFEWFFEMGSGIGKLNGWDGLWGLEYNTNRKSICSSVVLEYLQTTNQSGPIHWAPGDFPGTSLTPEATGSDNYYNNYFYNGWAHYGQGNGNPLLKSPIYNKDGYLSFTDNRIKAVHLGGKGYLSHCLEYKLLVSYRKSWGTPLIPSIPITYDISGLIHLSYTSEYIKNWTITTQLGIDKGNLFGNNIGGALLLKKEFFIKQ
ncbi:MAG: capsule assembly Wzi family protein [Bacteroidales bacterium]